MSQKRLKLLEEEDVIQLYARPQFNATERSYYFAVPSDWMHSIKLATASDHKIPAALYLILQYGYFKARHQFFKLDYQEVKEDITFVMTQYFPETKSIPTILPTRATQRDLRTKVLEEAGFSDDTQKVDHFIQTRSAYLAKITSQIDSIVEEVIKALETEKYVLPPYSRLQDILGATLKNEETRLKQAVTNALTPDIEEALQALFLKKETLYAISAIKLDAKSFQTKEMTAEIKKLTLCASLYTFAQTFLPTLMLSRSMIEYYAELLQIYTMDRLDKIPKALAYFYIICYLYRRYEKVMNNVTQGFIYYVDKYQKNSKNYSKTELAILSDPLENNATSIGELMAIFANKKLMKGSGKTIGKTAFNVMPEEEIASLSQQLIHGKKHKKQRERELMWSYHKSNYQAILTNLRPLFLAIDFTGDEDLKHIFSSIEFLKSYFAEEEKKPWDKIPYADIPKQHIRPASLLHYFTQTENNKDNQKKNKRRKNKKCINLYQYEFHLYWLIRENIKNKKIHVNTSTGFKSFDKITNIPKNWEEQKEELLKTVNNRILSRPIDETLDELEGILEPAIEKTNRRAMNGDNQHINITYHRDGTVEWTLPYPKRNQEIDNPFYNQLDIKLIAEIYDFVGNVTGFSNAFTHIKSRGAKSQPDYVANKAVTLANGTTQGTHEFSKKCNIKYQRLQTAEENCVRLHTIREAAAILINCMMELPIFEHYNLSHQHHGSGDGTKKKTKRRVIKARFSSKYFGSDMGLVIMTLCLNHVPFATRIISPNEHESHFIYPMLSQHGSMIDPDIISTDTAGANNVNDFVYYLIGKTHAPCYRSTPRKAKTICGFKSEKEYQDLLIKPSKTVNRKLIKKHWPELVPILTSLLSHDVSQEDIIKTLSSHEYKSGVKEALWELNHILKSIRLLKYIDDIQYRRDIRTSLNRGEAYHQLVAKIMAVGGGSFRGMSELEVEIWNGCTHLIALIIIYYNMHLLSKLYETALAKGDKAALKYLARISPVASQHLQLGGLYALSETPATINVDQVVEALEKILEENLKTQTFLDDEP